MKKNIILVDYKISDHKDNNFVEVLDEFVGGDRILKEKITNNLHNSIFDNVLRILLYFLFPLTIVFKRYNYNRIIGWQQFYGLNFAFWCRIFHLKKVNDLTVMTFIYKRKRGFLGALYHKYIEYVVTSKYIDRFICFAKEECKYYSDLFGVNKKKFMYIPLGINDIKANNEISDEGFLFATGRSNRNYNFIIDTLSNTRYKLIIASDIYKRTHLPKNISILQNCYGKDMLDLMSKCHCVLIPLKDLTMSSGQLVALQAMSLGKPVICTNSDGIKDYVINEVTGFLVDNLRESWLEIINMLYSDTKLYVKMNKESLFIFNEKYTENAMFKRIARCLS